MDKEYVLAEIRARQVILKNRYRLMCHCQDENGQQVKATVAYTLRHNIKKELNLLLLVEECIVGTPGKLVAYSDDAMDALERLLFPIERHKRKIT